MKHLLYLLLLFPFALSCDALDQKPQNRAMDFIVDGEMTDEDLENEEISTYTPENYSSLAEELKKTDFVCRSHECPENVGLLYLNFSGDFYRPEIGRCTGFLVKNDMVATNSHCIPKDIRYDNAYCEGDLAIRFMRADGKESIHECKGILEFSELETIGQDYAFFKIEPTDIKPITIAQNGLKDNSTIKLASVTPMKDTLGEILTVKPCRVVVGSLINFKGTTPWSETGLSRDCQGIRGNSGSPVLNTNGEAIGILQSSMNDLPKTFKTVFDTSGKVPDHFIFTNFSCVEY